MTFNTIATHPGVDLSLHIDQIGRHIADYGTDAESRRLADLADAVRGIAPGAAAALTDEEASEISRLRAFAVAATAALRLTGADQTVLLSIFDGTSSTSAPLAAA